MTLPTFRKLITSRQVWVFGLISISFIRFGLSGSNIVTYAQNDFINMSPFAIAYIDFIYSLAQLGAGVLAGLYFAKRIGTKNTLLIGLLFSVGFNFIILFVTDPTILFISYSLSGFGYGLTYNSLIGIALEPYEPKEREMSMAIFQTFFRNRDILWGQSLRTHTQPYSRIILDPTNVSVCLFSDTSDDSSHSVQCCLPTQRKG